MGKSDDEAEQTRASNKERKQEQFFCNICKLDYPTDNQFMEHKWSPLHHNQIEKSYGKDILHRCILCYFECYTIANYMKHLIGDQHKNVLKKRKEDAEMEAARKKQLSIDTERLRKEEEKRQERMNRNFGSHQPFDQVYQSIPSGQINRYDYMEQSGHQSNAFCGRHKWFPPSGSMFRPRKWPTQNQQYNQHFGYGYSHQFEWNHSPPTNTYNVYSRTADHYHNPNETDFSVDVDEPIDRYYDHRSSNIPTDVNNRYGNCDKNERQFVSSDHKNIKKKLKTNHTNSVYPHNSKTTGYNRSRFNASSSEHKNIKKRTDVKDPEPRQCMLKNFVSSKDRSSSKNVKGVGKQTRRLSKKDVPSGSTSTKNSEPFELQFFIDRGPLSNNSHINTNVKHSKEAAISNQNLENRHSKCNDVESVGQECNSYYKELSQVGIPASEEPMIREDGSTQQDSVTNDTNFHCVRNVDTDTADGNVPLTDLDSDQSGDKESLLNVGKSSQDALIRHDVVKTLKPNVGASRSRLHAGMRSNVDDIEKPVQKLVKFLNTSKSKHSQEAEMAKLKKMLGPLKKQRKRYRFQLASSNGQPDDLPLNTINLLEQLSGFNLTDMKIKEDPELMAELNTIADSEQYLPRVAETSEQDDQCNLSEVNEVLIAVNINAVPPTCTWSSATTISGAPASGATTSGVTTYEATMSGATTSCTRAYGDTPSGATTSGATTYEATMSGARAYGATTSGATTSGVTTSSVIIKVEPTDVACCIHDSLWQTSAHVKSCTSQLNSKTGFIVPSVPSLHNHDKELLVSAGVHIKEEPLSDEDIPYLGEPAKVRAKIWEPPIIKVEKDPIVTKPSIPASSSSSLFTTEKPSSSSSLFTTEKPYDIIFQRGLSNDNSIVDPRNKPTETHNTLKNPRLYQVKEELHPIITDISSTLVKTQSVFRKEINVTCSATHTFTENTALNKVEILQEMINVIDNKSEAIIPHPRTDNIINTEDGRLIPLQPTTRDNGRKKQTYHVLKAGREKERQNIHTEERIQKDNTKWKHELLSEKEVMEGVKVHDDSNHDGILSGNLDTLPALKCVPDGPEADSRVLERIASTQSDLNKLWNISIEEELLHLKLIDVEKDISKLKVYLQKKQLFLASLEATKEQLDRDVKELRCKRMHILEEARHEGDNDIPLYNITEADMDHDGKNTCIAVASREMPICPKYIHSDSTEEIMEGETHSELGPKKHARKRSKEWIEEEKHRSDMNLTAHEITSSESDVTSYPPAIVLSAGDTNIDMQTVVSLLANPAIMQQIQDNFNQLGHTPSKPENDALIVTLPAACDKTSEDNVTEVEMVQNKKRQFVPCENDFDSETLLLRGKSKRTKLARKAKVAQDDTTQNDSEVTLDYDKRPVEHSWTHARKQSEIQPEKKSEKQSEKQSKKKKRNIRKNKLRKNHQGNKLAN